MNEEFRAVRLDELDQCIDLWSKVFQQDSQEYFLPYFHGDPWFRFDYTRVCVVGGRVVSAIQICQRKVAFGTSYVVMGGIANVATLPEFRGRGYSSRLLKDCIWVMKSHGMDFSMLFTGIQPFYERLGWQSLPIPYVAGTLKHQVNIPSFREYDVRHRIREDLPEIKRVYDAFNAARPLSVRRTDQYWDGYIQSRLGSFENVYVALRNGKVVGYLHSPLSKETFRVEEVAYYPGEEGCVYPLVACAAARARKIGAEKVRCRVPHEPSILSALNKVTQHLELAESKNAMCRLIDTGFLGRRLLPELNRRAAHLVLPRSEISLDTDFGNLGFTYENQTIRLGTENPVHVRLTQAQFFSLLFGLKPINELDVSVPFEAFQVLSFLFPRQRAVFWGMDAF